MRTRLAFLAATGALWAACQCGGPADLCEAVKCVSPLTCDSRSGRCVDPSAAGGGTGAAGGGAGSGVGGGMASGGGTGGSGGGTGGGAPAVCTPACAGALVCDGASNTCKTCLVGGAGCSAPTPACDPAGNNGQGRCVGCTTGSCAAPTPFCDQSIAPSGACVGCRNFLDCPTFGTTCNLATHTCVPEDGGGAGGGGGTGGSTGAGGGAPGPTVTFDDAGSAARCLPFDGGSKMPCTTECPRGFVCVAGLCELRGSGGPVQVTLRFPVSEDLDLHVVEPVDAGTCEIWYGNTNFDAGPLPFPFPIPLPASCGAYGWLDLDSNPACKLDHVNIENVIYPPSQAPHLGTYKVRVDYYQHCSATAPVPYEVEVRALGQARYYCGTFQTNQADNGAAGSGRDITQFTLK